jgi:ornithine--oxo-acid transaminase
MGRRALLQLMQPGDHGSTFGGNPLAAAVAEASLAVLMESRLAARAAQAGRRLQQGLRNIASPHIKEIRGRGLLLGVEIDVASGTARQFSERLLQRGVMSKDTHKQVLRLAPPLIIEDEEIDWLLSQLKAVLQ